MRIVANCHGIFNDDCKQTKRNHRNGVYIVYAAFAKHNHFVCCFIDSSGCINYAVKIEITQSSSGTNWRWMLNWLLFSFVAFSADTQRFKNKNCWQNEWEAKRSDKDKAATRQKSKQITQCTHCRGSRQINFVLYSMESCVRILCQVFFFSLKWKKSTNSRKCIHYCSSDKRKPRLTLHAPIETVCCK